MAKQQIVVDPKIYEANKRVLIETLMHPLFTHDMAGLCARCRIGSSKRAYVRAMVDMLIEEGIVYIRKEGRKVFFEVDRDVISGKKPTKALTAPADESVVVPPVNSEQTDNDFFRRTYYSPTYAQYLESNVFTDDPMESCWDLTNEFAAQLKSEAFPIVWDGQTKRAEAISTLHLPQRLCEGYVLTGFGKLNAAGKKVLQAIPLPVYGANKERVVNVMKKAWAA